MRYKRWCFGMLGFILAVLLFIMGVNYYADIYGYFTFQSGDYADVDFKIGSVNVYYRVFKANHILNFGDQYDAYILGGSKAGSFHPEKMQEMDGYRYYNLFEYHGTMTEYKLIVDFLLKHTDVKKIIISLSANEVSRLTFDSDADIMQIPAVWKDEPQLMEYLHFLTLDVTKGLQKIWDEMKNGKTVYTRNFTGGERDVQYLYPRRDADWDGFLAKNLLKNFDARMARLFKKNQKADYYDECLDIAGQIKAECDAAGVELEFWFTPTFISGMARFESTYFWDYLRELAQITNFWDFNGYSDINLNPSNYIDTDHCTYALADFVIDTISGKASYPGFGYYVTKDNVDEYLQKRKEDYNRLKQEYLETGTIALKSKDDASFIP